MDFIQITFIGMVRNYIEYFQFMFQNVLLYTNEKKMCVIHKK